MILILLLKFMVVGTAPENTRVQGPSIYGTDDPALMHFYTYITEKIPIATRVKIGWDLITFEHVLCKLKRKRRAIVDGNKYSL